MGRRHLCTFETRSTSASDEIWHAALMVFRVEVFPLEPDVWIAVIDAPKGPLSTQVPRPGMVMDDVRTSIEAVLEIANAEVDLVDDLGRPWTPAGAKAQMQRLDIDFSPGWQRRARIPWWQRVFGRRRPWVGDCRACGHDWRQHVLAEGVCGECAYEIEHEEPDAPLLACRLMPPPATRTTRTSQ